MACSFCADLYTHRPGRPTSVPEQVQTRGIVKRSRLSRAGFRSPYPIPSTTCCGNGRRVYSSRGECTLFCSRERPGLGVIPR